MGAFGSFRLGGLLCLAGDELKEAISTTMASNAGKESMNGRIAASSAVARRRLA